MCCFLSDLPKSFQASLHALITAGNMEEGVRGTMRAGGCNASRSTFVAACFGAMVRFVIGPLVCTYMQLYFVIAGPN